MSKHTPGPWRAVADHPDNAAIYVRADDNEVAVCFGGGEGKCDKYGVWGEQPIREANARLIAAAPDLLAALKSIKAGLSNTGSSPGKWMTQITKRTAWEIAYAAIAKAEGRT